ncbi:hypothetical protein SDC9_133066 [bioreactor metagenome]|uniref:Uncharacterized protein n=1 Tax=bioreactor metagenome TaxID=1076179 RepID=A0A645DAN9_9ZZZZ
MMDLLQDKHQSCQRSIESCGQTGTGTARKKDFFFDIIPLCEIADALPHCGSQLDGRALPS